jgi:transcriptional regulator with XRE-family HTH domain
METLTEVERKIVGERFAQIRKSHHYNQREMAEILDVSPSFISEIERGAKEPSKRVLINFQNRFSRSIEWVLTGIDKPEAATGKLEALIETQKQKINELEASIMALNQEKLTLQAQLITIQAELLKAKDELLKK